MLWKKEKVQQSEIPTFSPQNLGDFTLMCPFKEKEKPLLPQLRPVTELSTPPRAVSHTTNGD